MKYLKLNLDLINKRWYGCCLIKSIKMYNNFRKILLLIFIAVNLHVAQDSTWQIVDEMKFPVSGAKAVVHDSLIYVIGGYSDSLQANVNWIQQFDPTTNDWSIVARMIERRYGLFVGVYDDKLYIYGGINEVNDNAFILEEWDFESSATTAVSTNELFDRVFSTGTIYENNFYMIGGYAASRGSSADLPYIANYNFDSDLVSAIDDTTYQSNELPIQQLSVRIDEQLYLFGGAFNGVLQDFDVINLTSFEAVNYEQRFISPRAAGVAIYSPHLNSIYLIGGYNEISPAIASTEVVTDYSTYPVVKQGPSLNYARRNLSAVLFNDKIYVFGGENASGEVLRTVEAISSLPVSVVDEKEFEKEFQLHQNYPNPFNPETNISFTLKNGGDITIEIFNSLGEKVDEIFRGYSQPGLHTIRWDGNNFKDQSVPTGIYFYRLSSKENFVTKKMLLLK